ncbi:MAG: redox-sensing transcriptional repressor Rex [Lachnospiraceae bacterium]|nr:redox-sensing transcriptional repressor Rex [Lachnospiraceae bacterium]
MAEKSISSAVIHRLPRYYRYLGELKENGVERISSAELSQIMSVTASQIRQDLNHFGGFGQQGYGYNVAYLYTEIGKILGIDRRNDLIVIGAGNLGRAIANYGNFERRGFHIVAMFDRRADLIGMDLGNGLTVRNAADLEQYLAEHPVRMAAIAIPKTGAPEVAERLIKSGVKAIWNFAHIDLEVPDDVVVENVHLSESLMELSYKYHSRHPEAE